MKALLAALLLALATTVHAQQPRTFSQPELEALLAPIALYPDDLVEDILVAATYPEDVHAAAAWLRANPHLQGDDAVRAAEGMPWHPSLKTLLAFPDLVARMDESPQWLNDLGDAYLVQQPQVMATVQVLRQRAQASGHLGSDGYQSVERNGEAIVVQPLQSGVVYLPWYNPLVVYGGWWSVHRPILWRPWHARVVHVHRPIHVHRTIDVHRPIHVHKDDHRFPHRDRRPVFVNPPPSHAPPTVHNHVHQAQKARPIVQGARIEPPIDFRKHDSDRRRVDRGRHDVDRRPVVIERPRQAERRQVERPRSESRHGNSGARFESGARFGGMPRHGRGEVRGGGHRGGGRG